MLDRCPLEIPALPPPPVRMPCPKGIELCYSPAEAWRLSALIETLTNVYRQAKECAESNDGV